MTEQAHTPTFRIATPQAALDDLTARIRRTRWTESHPGEDWSRGVPESYLRGLADYWADEFDWRAVEADLNRFPQDVRTIDDIPIHYVHARSPRAQSFPLLLLHGWPSSPLEFLDVIDPLLDLGYDVIVPSLPGFAWSGTPQQQGWGVQRMAKALAALMGELGHDGYGVHGGDWGTPIAVHIASHDEAHVRGIHLTSLVTVPDASEIPLMSEAEMGIMAEAMRFDAVGTGWRKIQSTRPVTLAYSLADSPVGQLAWIIEKYQEWSSADGVPEEAIDRDRLLAAVTLYWLTNTAGTSAQIYYESNRRAEDFAATWLGPWDVRVPVGVVASAKDVVRPIRLLAANRFPTLCHWSDWPDTGHFPALEAPQRLVDDLDTFFTEHGTHTVPGGHGSRSSRPTLHAVATTTERAIS